MQTLERHSDARIELTASGVVLLVSCYELGHQPLSLAFPLAFLREAGYAPVAVDTAIDALPDAAIETARFVAIAVPMHTALRLGTEIAARVRRVNPMAAICFYGLYAWLNADYLLREHGDYVIGGEVEVPLLELVRALETGRDASVPIPGVSDRQHRATPSIQRTTFPVPQRDTLPEVSSYARLMLDGIAVPAGYTEATRGCHHTCLHCPVVPVYRGRFFAIPRATVLADIRQQVLSGAGHITFGDPDFLNGPTHALRICRELHAEFPRVTFDITTRIEHILQHREIFAELKDLGCVFVLSAVESVSDHVLLALDKGHTRADVIEALGVLDAAGITMRPSLLPFTPWTTLTDYLDLLTFFEEYDLIDNVDPVHFSIRLLVPPGSAMLDQPGSEAWAGELNEAAFTHTWGHPDPRVDALQRAVVALMERDAANEAPASDTFASLKALAWDSAGATLPIVGRKRKAPPGQPPRLTESWFC